MNVLSLLVRELVGLFIDDEFLAIAVLAVVLLTAGLAFWTDWPKLLDGAALILGCVAVLMSSVYQASRKDRA
ncbi:hypothetical protein [Terrarubrum flagellatum]|uniref:hypothetical protein n=1 Tax=Terrirubrum flagellatum TaxID=2895980 RepID=UPI0031455AD1